MYPAPPDLPTERFAVLPTAWHRTDSPSSWVDTRGAGPLHSFLEGPAFDRTGTLYCTDLAHGRVFSVSAAGEFSLVADYDGEPNGLAVHRDGRVLVADRRHGIVCLDGQGGFNGVVGATPQSVALQGVNDLTFSPDGDLWFTDQGGSDLRRPTGRVYRLRAGTGALECVVEGLAGPNGIAFSPDGRLVYIAITRDNAIYSLALGAGGAVGKLGRFIQLSGSPTGPDGLAVDVAGNLAVVHAGAGTVWLFSADGEPLLRVRSCAGRRTTNVAYGGPDNRTLFITEAEQGAVLQARMPHPGLPLYSHQGEPPLHAARTGAQ
ncbi:SMP-30/gluconolactonase/LRE family protein [Pigmentiphaga litoralis]|uniref:SMP-30/gluconolactonase/LRE family protein n=1 Tax=Pigmentiphaga litoralis TaxID=516702 RepID=UPI003B43D0BD